jgi:hypothetical protein
MISHGGGALNKRIALMYVFRGVRFSASLRCLRVWSFK